MDTGSTPIPGIEPRSLLRIKKPSRRTDKFDAGPGCSCHEAAVAEVITACVPL